LRCNVREIALKLCKSYPFDVASGQLINFSEGEGAMNRYDQACVADVAVLKPIGMGHNYPSRPKLFGLKAAWLRFADGQELKRLAKLHVRIERREQALADLRAERTKIMNRCIRRMRRKAGKV
jgi:hypothetical protein